jgi:hypothetical protein
LDAGADVRRRDDQIVVIDPHAQVGGHAVAEPDGVLRVGAQLTAARAAVDANHLPDVHVRQLQQVGEGAVTRVVVRQGRSAARGAMCVATVARRVRGQRRALHQHRSGRPDAPPAAEGTHRSRVRSGPALFFTRLPAAAGLHGATLLRFRLQERYGQNAGPSKNERPD